MANRVLLGKASTARGGSTKYGLWISKPGQDVTTCTDDQLIFNTDKGAGGDIKSLFQILRPVSNQTTVSVSNSFSGTANQSQNFDFANPGFAVANLTAIIGSSGLGSDTDEDSDIGNFNTAPSLTTVNTTTVRISVTQTATLSGAITGRVVMIPNFAGSGARF
tara:strand:+ start:351 stop:839 length:489 start_codon:yes stop_codon:yes gene_type:complete